MDTLIVLASLVLVIGITSLGIVLFGKDGKDGKALKALGAICFVPLIAVLVGGCMSMPDAGYVKFWVICCLMMLFASIIFASGLTEK